MRVLRKMSIQRKQMLIIMLTSGAALLLACLTFVAYDVLSFRQALIKKVSVLAEAIGNNCTATIEYNDPVTAEETLSALRAESSVVAACIYTRKGTRFATYHRAEATPFEVPERPGAGYEFRDNHLFLFHPVVQRGESIGTIFVASDLTELRGRLARYPAIVGGMFLAALLFAFLLSRRLQRFVSDPILHLALVARAVALDKNYSVRATKQSEDELGQLIDGFNEMLGQIQHRDGALQAAHDNLERRVEERTEQLRQSKALYTSLVEHLPVHVYRKDNEGRFVFVNSHFCEFMGKGETEILGKTIADIAPSLDKAQRETREDGGIMKTGNMIEREEENPDASGTSRFLQVIKSPVFGHDDQVIGTQGILFDITARKQAEAKLEEAHRELVSASRQAGMAEVATSVLHNVGNVLNSVNVSANVVTDSLKKSKAANLARIAQLFREHSKDLANFLSNDPKGQQVPEYLQKLSEHLALEQTQLLKEMESLRQNIEHIKNIVVMQQSYAKVSGVTEVVKVADLVEDALKMNAGVLVRRDVEIVRDFEDHVPQINVEKHKVLQILVNLIRNARFACDESGNDQKKLTLRVRNGGDKVRIAVADNGVGIPPENITRIFNHGFTTRKTGHGFGLHSGALAAKEMGGTLVAESEGKGKGATFILELPLKPKT